MDFSIAGRSNLEEVCQQREETVSLLDYANEHRHSESFNDVEICVGKEMISANKMVLSCFSQFFEKLFKTDMREQRGNSYNIQCVNACAVKSIVDYIYSGSIKINTKNVCDLLSGSDYLLVDDVKKFCFEFLKKAVSINNCLILLKVAEIYQNEALKAVIKHYILDNFRAVTCNDDFKKMEKDEMKAFISVLNCDSLEEASFYRAIVEWTYFNEEKRSRDFVDLFLEIDLKRVSLKFLRDNILQESLVIENLVCTKLLVQAINNHLCGDAINKNNASTKIVSFGGQETRTDVVEVFNILRKPRKKFPDLPLANYNGSCVKLNNLLYYIGGELSKKMWQINLNEENPQWKKMTSMTTRREEMGCAVFNGAIVVCGGWHGAASTSVEAYLPSFDSWCNLSSINTPRYGNQLVECKGYLYTIGGHGVKTNLPFTVERLKEGSTKWDNVAPIQTPRYRLAAVACSGAIYALGGISDCALKSCEKYDIGRNEWKYINDMHFRRSECSACVLQGKIFVVGGLDERRLVVREIECYDPLTNKWSIVGRTDEKLHGHCVLAV